jgi:hypothetical protein
MNLVERNINAFKLPYKFGTNLTKRPLKLTAHQQRMLDGMEFGKWYEGPICFYTTMMALVDKGYVVMAFRAKRGPDGKLVALTPEELVVECILNESPTPQPCRLFTRFRPEDWGRRIPVEPGDRPQTDTDRDGGK